MTTLAQISSGQAQKEVTANQNFEALSPAAAFGRKASTTTGLTWGYYGGAVFIAGVVTVIADGTIALTASTTNYVERDASGVVTKNTVGFTSGKYPLYKIVTGTSTVTSYIDSRVMGFIAQP